MNSSDWLEKERGEKKRESREKESRMNKMTTATIFCSQKNKETLRIQVTNILNFKWS